MVMKTNNDRSYAILNRKESLLRTNGLGTFKSLGSKQST